LILGIDLSNIRLGGGITHINELLSKFDCSGDTFNKVILWGPITTLDQLPNHSWLFKRNPTMVEGGLVQRLIWQTFHLSKIAKKEGCSLLFIPGGTFLGSFSPSVVMSQNLIPFELGEIKRYGISLRALKFLVLRYLQSFSMRRSAGVIFLTNYAKKVALRVIGATSGEVVVIPHGLSDRFKNSPFQAKLLEPHSVSMPIKAIYVSNIDVYKHQVVVLEAISILRSRGYSISIEFIGPSVPFSLKELNSAMMKHGAKGSWAKYSGEVSYENMREIYANADLAVFASSCETFGITLLEKMASSLPISCSNMSSMSEILEDAGIYFDPLNKQSIADALEQYIVNPDLRQKKRELAYGLAQRYSWNECAKQTFYFLHQVAINFKNKK